MKEWVNKEEIPKPSLCVSQMDEEEREVHVAVCDFGKPRQKPKSEWEASYLMDNPKSK